jgi:hypothetical protein
MGWRSGAWARGAGGGVTGCVGVVAAGDVVDTLLESAAEFGPRIYTHVPATNSTHTTW